MNKILSAIDFSDASLNALEHAAAVAEACGSSLTLLHVFTEDDFNRLFEEDEDHVNITFKEKSYIIEERLKALQKEIADAEHRHIKAIDYKLEFGDFDQTVQELEEEQYDLIVMGSRGMSYHQGLILGSNTLNIISKTQTTVLAVPETATYHPYNYIIYASDLHSSDRVGLKKLIPLANAYNARIQVVHFTSKSSDKIKGAFDNFKVELSSFIDYAKIGYELHQYNDELNLAMEEYISDKKGYLLTLLDKKHNFFENLFHESLIKRMTYITDTPLLVIKS
jgi:nucleotide-binding universal stress UspA family protein